MLFLVVASVFPSTATTALLFQHHSCTPKFHHLLWHFSESFHQHLTDQTAPDWLWHSSLFVYLSADTVQILQQHNASSFCPSKSSGTNFYKFPLLRQLHRQLSNDFDESQQALYQRDLRSLMWKAVQIWGCLWWMFCPIWNAGTTHDIVYGSNNPVHKPVTISLLQHLKSLCQRFSQFETEFEAHALFLKIVHFSTYKKSRRVLNTHSFNHVYFND